MRTPIILRILGVLLMVFSSTMLPPLILSLLAGDGVSTPFLTAYLLTLATGLASWLPVRRLQFDLRFRDGFLVVVLFWTVLAAFGALPLVLTTHPQMSVTDAFFESMSGLTTTGATVLTGIDDLPLSIRYYRQQLQWLGGMGIIVLAVAVMPMLGVGGMQLYRAETPGPVKDTKLTPRITETAKALWYIYLGLTVLCAVGYWIAGMSIFDAVSHSFATIAIGGFSTHDASIGFFDNRAIASVAMIFMVISGINFSLHFVAWRKKSISSYFRDSEVLVYLSILLVVFLIVYFVLLSAGTFDRTADVFWHSLFQVISVGTTTGFTTTGFHWWPTFIPIMLIILSAVGGCAGSTAGGMKVIRVALLYKQGRRETAKLVHPNALIPIKFNGKPVPEHVINAVWGFFSLYVLSYVVLSLLMTAVGTELVTAFSAVTACLNNLGPGLGEVAANYASLSTPAKWILSFAMLLGRLELFTLLVLFSSAFWRN
ncbi:MAG: TrkH family potassium uptake protein [Gammaproteobacteria bacterium]|nr:TrkH family potassium uptake protein [Gammaproteobacteria bacterium]MDH3469331.1 TrkH family potassium uptake protein [Gammaproteobacteria bacterium]